MVKGGFGIFVMNEEINLEELSKEVEDLRKSVNTQRFCLGVLSILVVYLIVRPGLDEPFGFSFLLIIGLILIPIVIVISTLERRGL